MSKKQNTAAAKITAVKKGEIYETKHQELVEVMNGRLKDEGDLGTSFEGKSITTHETTGKVVKSKTTDRYYLDDITRKLTTAEFKEWAEAGRREVEAAADAKIEPSAPAPTKAKAKTKAEPKAKATKEKPAKTGGKMSALDAAAKVLGEAKEPMTTKAMIEAMSTKGYWTSPGGKTPHATLYSAILREINDKGNESRFKKTDRGQFAIAKNV